MRARHTCEPSSAVGPTLTCELWRIVARRIGFGELFMGKGMDRKKETKKKPAKSLEEKRAAKREKKATRG
jgi:predicted homoserine dehydrogenase-like protein